MKQKFKSLLDWFKLIVTNEDRLALFQAELIYMTFAAVSLFMSIVNVITLRIPLLIATASFCLLCLLNYIFARISKKGQTTASYLFMVEIIVLFTYFLVTGGTDNFSVVWLLLLPTVGLFFFGKLKGSIMSGVVFIIMLLLFHMPGIKTFCMADYGDTFRLRFPIVYACCFLIAMLLEEVRRVTASELEAIRNKYQDLYKRDALTGALNRYGMDETMQRYRNNPAGKALATLDIDYFKTVNDTYGHKEGDSVLQELVKVLQEALPKDAILHRTGGEEFVIVFYSVQNSPEIANDMIKQIRNHMFTDGEINLNITISMGLAVSEKEKTTYEELMKESDRNLYRAKDAGRDRLIWSAI